MKGLPLRRETHTLRDGTHLSTLVGGPEGGEAVVLLHGGGTDHAWLSWSEAIPALLASGYRVVAPDMPGYGESPSAAWPATRPNLSRALAELVDVLGLPPAVFVGISMGGSLALAQALERPRSVRALVPVGSYGLARRSALHSLYVWLARLPQGTNSLNPLLARSPLAVRLLLRSFVFNSASLTPQLVAQVQRALQNPASARAFAQFQRDELRWAGFTTCFMEQLTAIAVPTLVIHGSRDSAVPLTASQEAARRIPGAELRVFEGAGHWTQREEPGRFAYELLRFLGGLSPQVRA